MPQLDISTFTPQLVWLAVWFVVLYLLMAKLGLPRIAAALEARRTRRENDLARAAQLKSQADAASTAFQQIMAAARAEAQAKLRETAERMAGQAADRQRQLAAALAQQIATAERRIAESKDQALGDIRTIAADVGRAMVEKLTGTAPDTATMAAAVDDALAGRAA